MYSLHSLNIKGYGPYRDATELYFREGVTVVVGYNQDSSQGLVDSNGAGKTQILEAISWTLFGQAPDLKKQSEAMTHGGVETACTLTLKSPDEDLVIRRRVRGNRHEVSLSVQSRENPVEYKGDVERVQAEINHKIGCSYALFKAVLYLGQEGESAKFIRMKPQERAAVLGNLIDDTYFQIGAKIAGEEAREGAKTQTALQTELMAMRGFHGQVEADVAALEREIQDFLATERARLDKANAEYVIARDNLTRASRELLDIRKAQETPGGLEGLSRALAEEQTKLQRLEKDRGLLEHDLRRLPQRQYLEANQECCPTCHQGIGEAAIAHIESARAALELKLQHCRAALEAQERVVQEFRDRFTRVRDAANSEKVLEEKVQTLKVVMTHAKDATLPRNPDSLVARHGVLVERRNEAWAKIETLQAQTVAWYHHVERLKAVQHRFGRDARDFLFDAIRGPLEVWTKYYMEISIDTGLTVQFPSENSQEHFEILVWNQGYTQDFRRYSGGEKWRIQMAILLGLRKVLDYANQSRLDFLLLDDPIGALDDAGVYNFFEMLRKLTQDEIKTILVTVPRASNIPGNTNTIEVYRQGGKSHAVSK